MRTSQKKNTTSLKALSGQLGGILFGVADVTSLNKDFLFSFNEYNGLHYGISMGVPLSADALRGIQDKPTLLYKWHYRQANNLLDRIAFLIAQYIQVKGYRALPIASSQIVDWEKQRAHVSHRTIGEAAGLGWRGRNNLLVNPKYGAQIRLVTVLTDMPLLINEPMAGDCGKCFCCVQACPVEALGRTAREYNFDKCFDKLKEFSKERGIGQYICGVCVRACQGKRDV
jgi:epoxyqueuosine reductase